MSYAYYVYAHMHKNTFTIEANTMKPAQTAPNSLDSLIWVHIIWNIPVNYQSIS